MINPPPSAPDSGGPCPHCGEAHPASYTHCPKTGKSLASGRALVGRTIADRYRVIGLLGEGGMGAVYVAEHLLIGRKVAIKRLHPELAADDKAVQRFQREARAAAATGHEHIVEILDLGFAEDGAPYLVMEYLRGQSLAALLRKERKLEAARACRIVGQVLDALEAVHAQQIVHRDLKPDNVFLTRRGSDHDYVKLLDFGISKIPRHDADSLDLTRTGVMLGTPFYMSPEQARGIKALDHRVDLYATGVMLYECLCGQLPFEGENYHHLLQLILREQPRPVREQAPDVSAALEALVMRSIAKDPGARYQRASEMLAALAPFGAEVGSSREAFESGESVPPPSVLAPAGTPATTLGEAPNGSLTNAITTPVMAHSRAESKAEAKAEPAPDARPRGVPIRPEIRGVPPVPRVSAALPISLSVSRLSDPPRTSEPPRALDVAREPLRASGALPSTGTPPPTSRYFYATSEDWDEARARAVIEANKSSPGREPSGSFVLRSSRESPTSEPSANYRPSDPETGVREAPPAYAAEVNVKASLPLSLLEIVEAQFGAAQATKVREQLDRDTRARFESVILPMAWVPVSLLEQLLRAAERVVGTGEGQLASTLGRGVAERELATTHRLFMQSATPTSATERLPQLVRAYHARGDARVSVTVSGGVRVELEIGAPESFLYAWFFAGFFGRMLELTGARDVKVGVVSCRGRGDDKTALVIRWR